ncbi:MAG: hypothetical protein JXB17_04775 [Bacteroidales bacterium]|nr:hypothetical protein [Bacteroidales bacterium]
MNFVVIIGIIFIIVIIVIFKAAKDNIAASKSVNKIIKQELPNLKQKWLLEAEEIEEEMDVKTSKIIEGHSDTQLRQYADLLIKQFWNYSNILTEDEKLKIGRAYLYKLLTANENEKESEIEDSIESYSLLGRYVLDITENGINYALIQENTLFIGLGAIKE